MSPQRKAEEGLECGAEEVKVRATCLATQSYLSEIAKLTRSRAGEAGPSGAPSHLDSAQHV